jgi:uncharacterized repeat protein (TIGR03803 family)
MKIAEVILKRSVVKRNYVALTFAALLATIYTSSAAAQTFSTVHVFAGTDGANPAASLLLDSTGNLYGTTEYGGAHSYGTVFEINTAGKQTVLHSFCAESDCADGSRPLANLVLDSSKNLYGTTENGGDGGVDGVVFKLTLTGTETVLYTFKGGTDGEEPVGGLVRDSKGDLYGTTLGAHGLFPSGVAFKLDTRDDETVLHAFTSNPDGAGSVASMVMDTDGNLYGTTQSGGAHGAGTIFEISATGEETVLHSFCSGLSCSDGQAPLGNLIMDEQGNLYGTTSAPYGVVFKLSPEPNGTWTETVLYTFCTASNCSDGRGPAAGLIRDAEGNIYGTTEYGGTADYGVVFKLVTLGHETVLHNFTGGKDGGYPVAGLVTDAKGNLYGTAFQGGSAAAPFGSGVVFKIVP